MNVYTATLIFVFQKKVWVSRKPEKSLEIKEVTYRFWSPTKGYFIMKFISLSLVITYFKEREDCSFTWDFIWNNRWFTKTHVHIAFQIIRLLWSFLWNYILKSICSLMLKQLFEILLYKYYNNWRLWEY